MKVQNMTSNKGNKIANQFIVNNTLPTGEHVKCFQSYESCIVWIDDTGVFLDENCWDYSVTTSKYRNIFLNETKKETQAKIDSGEYILTDLNG